MKKKYTKQVTVGTDPHTGRRIRKRIYADSKAGLAQAEKDVIREYATIKSEKKVTVEQYFQSWFDAYASQLAINTQESYKVVLRKCKPIYGKQMRSVTRTDLQKIINQNWEHPDICKRLAGKLNTIWDLAVADGVVDRNIAVRLTRPKRHPAEKRPLTEREKQAIREAAFPEQEKLLVEILYQFGLRPGEALALCKSDVDYEGKTLTISKSLTHSHNRPVLKKTKTEQIRVLPVPDRFLEMFKKIKTLYFFVSASGELLTKREVYQLSDRIRKRINRTMGGTNRLRVTDMTLYTFRHNKATELYYMPGNLSLKAKAAYMGHSEQMFLRTYSHMLEDREETELLRTEVV